MPSISNIPPDDRPRERFKRQGIRALSDLELLALVIGSGTRDRDVMYLSAELLKALDKGSGNPDLSELSKIPGLGEAKGAKILAALEFSRRRIRPASARIAGASDVLPLVGHLAQKKQEHFVCITVNGAGEVIASRVISVGLVDRAYAHPREVFADAISDRASGIIIAHNHPAGNLKPSEADLQVTRQLKRAGTMLGIKLLDHVIFGPTGYYSMFDHGDL